MLNRYSLVLFALDEKMIYDMIEGYPATKSWRGKQDINLKSGLDSGIVFYCGGVMGMFARLFGGFSSAKKSEPRPERRSRKDRRICAERRAKQREFDIDRRSDCDRRTGIDWHAWI